MSDFIEGTAIRKENVKGELIRNKNGQLHRDVVFTKGIQKDEEIFYTDGRRIRVLGVYAEKCGDHHIMEYVYPNWETNEPEYKMEVFPSENIWERVPKHWPRLITTKIREVPTF